MRVLCIALLVTLPTFCFAQKESSNWYFGENAGLSFANGAPQALLDGALSTGEGCAVISDRLTGELLFYTDGVQVWNRNHIVMPNGNDLAGHWSSGQSALIVPFPDVEDRYYIFTTGQVSDSPQWWEPEFRYSIVHMNENAGLGDVVQKNELLLDSTAEKQAATLHCNGIDYWVVTHHMRRNAFYAYHITENGIDVNPVVSRVGEAPTSVNAYGVGYMKISPNGKMIAVGSSLRDGLPHTQQLFDFDNATGQVSNARILQKGEGRYGVSFSPDNSKLYMVSDNRGHRLYQYDLSAPDEESIRASETTIADLNEFTLLFVPLQIGPDGKIYVGMRNALGVIHNPNVRGVACNFRGEDVFLEDRRCNMGLPNFIDAWFDEGDGESACSPPISAFEADTELCLGDSLRVRDLSTRGPVSWSWTFEGGTPDRFTGQNPPPVEYSEPGVYTVTLETVNDYGSHSVDLTLTVVEGLTVEAGPDIVICPGAQAQLEARGASSYLWTPDEMLSDNTIANPIAAPVQTTRYIVTGTNEFGCIDRDTVTVRVEEKLAIRVNGDTATCAGAAIRLQASGGAQYLWSPSTFLDDPQSPEPLLSPPASLNEDTIIVYTIRVESGECASTASMSVRIRSLSSADAGPDTAICAGETVMLRASGGESYSWSPPEGIDDPNAAQTTARPERTTEYIATITGANGCNVTARTLVEVYPRDILTFAAESIEDAALPNELRYVHLFVQGAPSALAWPGIDTLHLELQYDAFGLGYEDIGIESGSAAPGWTWRALERPEEGLVDIYGSGPAITVAGPLCSVPFRIFLSNHRDLFSDVNITRAQMSGSGECYTVATAPGGITLSPFCLSDSRVIAVTSKRYSLSAPHPNPASASAEVQYGVGIAGHVRIAVYSALGAVVQTAVDAYKTSGDYRVTLEGLPSGAYYCVMESGPYRAMQALYIHR